MSEARANGRSLIYEPGAAPPPCHNRIPGARARSPAAARRRLALSPASDGEWCARSHAVSARTPYVERAVRLRARVTVSAPAAAAASRLPCAATERPARPTCRASSQPASDASPSVLYSSIRTSSTAHHTPSPPPSPSP